MEMNRGVCVVIRKGNRIGLIRTYAHMLLMNGSYLLVMVLPKDVRVMIGKQGVLLFQKGCYAYVGSAFNGLENRIQRHLRSQKKIHWHIDYFLPYTKIVAVFYKESNRKEECMIARMFEKQFIAIQGFGCSDCSCNSHLFYGSLAQICKQAIDFGMKQFCQDANS
jgi:Uri superfamily endonuclease